MYRLPFARSLVAFVAAVSIFSVAFVPFVVRAQNVCSLSDAECTSVNIGKPCICVQPPGITLTGLCVAVDDCQEAPSDIISSIGSWISEHSLLAAGIGIGAIGVAALISGSSGSSNPSDTSAISATTLSASAPTSPYAVPATSPASADSVSQLLSELQSTTQPPIASVNSPGASNPAATPSATATVPPSTESILPNPTTPINAATPASQSPAPNPTTPTPAATPASSAASALNAPLTPVEALLDALAPVSSAPASSQTTGQTSSAPAEESPPLTATPASSTPTTYGALASLPLLGFVNAPGTLWGDIQVGSTSATIFADENGTMNTQSMQFYGADSAANGSTTAYEACAQKPWAGSAFSAIIPASFFDQLCTEHGY